MARIGEHAPGLRPAPRPPNFCGDIDIRIAADGTWIHEGGPIGRKELVKLFASVLTRDEGGDYWLVTPVERARIAVEDAPFVVVGMEIEGQAHGQRLTFRTNIDECVTVGPAHKLYFRARPGSGELAPYVYVRDGLEALVGRAVYYDLVALGVEEDFDGARVFGVWSGGSFFPFAEAESLGEHG